MPALAVSSGRWPERCRNRPPRCTRWPTPSASATQSAPTHGACWRTLSASPARNIRRKHENIPRSRRSGGCAYLCLLVPGVGRVGVRRVPAAVRAGDIEPRGRRLRHREGRGVVDRHRGAERAVVVDPLGVRHRQAHAAVRADRAELVIQPVGQVVLVRAVVRRRVEEIVAGDLRAVLPPAALQRVPGRPLVCHLKSVPKL